MVDISSGNENGHFYVTYDSVSSASLYVSASSPLDYESASSHSLTIDAWDMNGDSVSGSLMVNVLDVDEGGATASDIVVQIDQAQYTITEGDTLALSGYGYSTTTTDPAQLDWDVNGDGDYSDGSGSAPSFTWSELQGLGIGANAAPYTVSLRATVGAAQQFATALLTVNAAGLPLKN